MKITVYETLVESFELDVPDNISGDELDEWVKFECSNGDHERSFVAVEDVSWQRVT